MKLRISLFVLAAVLLAAHFLRTGRIELVALCLAAPLLFLYRRRVSLILLQVLAYCAAIIWLDAAMELVASRQAVGMPWHFAAAILGTVAAFTCLSGALLNSRAIRERYSVRTVS